MWIATLTIVVAYLIGSVSSAVLIAKIAHLPDPRTEGSKNPGATNMLRLGGKKLALLTLLGDMGKGVIAVLLGRLLGQTGMILGFVSLAVLLGHVYPVFFKFQGGKGVATGLGGLLVLSPLLGFAALITWMIIAVLFRYSSLAALVTFGLVPFYSMLFSHFNYVIPLIAMGILIFWRHRMNLKRLHIGTETQISFLKK